MTLLLNHASHPRRLTAAVLLSSIVLAVVGCGSDEPPPDPAEVSRKHRLELRAIVSASLGVPGQALPHSDDVHEYAISHDDGERLRLSLGKRVARQGGLFVRYENHHRIDGRLDRYLLFFSSDLPAAVELIGVRGPEESDDVAELLIELNQVPGFLLTDLGRRQIGGHFQTPLNERDARQIAERLVAFSEDAVNRRYDDQAGLAETLQTSGEFILEWD